MKVVKKYYIYILIYRSGLPSIRIPAFHVVKEYCNITIYKNTNINGSNILDSSFKVLSETCDNLKSSSETWYNQSTIYNSNIIDLSFRNMIDILGTSIILVPIIAVLGNVAIFKAFGKSFNGKLLMFQQIIVCKWIYFKVYIML